MTDVRHKLHNYILENSQKLPPRVFQPLGASTLAHGWVRTVRTAQNLQKRRHSVGRTRRRGRLRAAQMVHSGPIEPRLWPGSIYKDRMRWPTHVNGLAAAIRYRAGHRHTPTCAVGCRSRTGLIVRSGVRRRSVGPHAWSRARVDRLAPRKEPKPSGRGQPFHTVLRAGVALSHPEKLV